MKRLSPPLVPHGPTPLQSSAAVHPSSLFLAPSPTAFTSPLISTVLYSPKDVVTPLPPSPPNPSRVLVRPKLPTPPPPILAADVLARLANKKVGGRGRRGPPGRDAPHGAVLCGSGVRRKGQRALQHRRAGPGFFVGPILHPATNKSPKKGLKSRGLGIKKNHKPKLAGTILIPNPIPTCRDLRRGWTGARWSGEARAGLGVTAQPPRRFQARRRNLPPPHLPAHLGKLSHRQQWRLLAGHYGHVCWMRLLRKLDRCAFQIFTQSCPTYW